MMRHEVSTKQMSSVELNHMRRRSGTHGIVKKGKCMGRGDKRSRRGKIFKASYGNTRPKATKSRAGTAGKSSQAGVASKKAPVAKKTK